LDINCRGLGGETERAVTNLWERGFMDVDNLSAYTIGGRKDAYGVVQKETSLKHLMSDCTDFEEEESLLKAVG
jgi:hypothetical protein